MLFMVIERFKDGDAVGVYRRNRERGRMLPDGLRYVESWVEPTRQCFQLRNAATRNSSAVDGALGRPGGV